MRYANDYDFDLIEKSFSLIKTCFDENWTEAEAEIVDWFFLDKQCMISFCI